MKWVATSDRVPLQQPPDGVVADLAVLAWDGRSVSEVLYRACYDPDCAGWFRLGQGRINDPLAWMPMPEPPKQ